MAVACFYERLVKRGPQVALATNTEPTRRDFLVVASSALVLPACAAEESIDIAPVPSKVFQHGVASGDALDDRVILWTRVTTKETVAQVQWLVATDRTLLNVVAQGEISTAATRDFTVKVDATGLSAGTTYYYQFALGGERSAIGRTKTTVTTGNERIRLAVVSCASYAHGYFHVYRLLAERRDLDGVIHLGDYIYEYGDDDYGSVRRYDPPHEIISLDDYRRRYAHYRKDLDLQEVHRQHVFFTVWDDHEFANNANPTSAQNHDEASEGSFADRKAAAFQAYSEWMPIRAPDPSKIFRAFRFGDNAELFLCDTRMWGRSPQLLNAEDPLANDPQRTLLGSDQEAWLFEGIRNSKARFKLVGQQVMMASLPLASLRNTDQWQGYIPARNRFLDLCQEDKNTGVVVLTGDIHTSWAADLVPEGASYDAATGTGSVAVEWVVPGVSSPGLGELLAGLGPEIEMKHPHFKLVDITRRGYLVLDIDATRAQAAYHHVDQVEDPALASEVMAGAFSLRSGERHLNIDPEEAPERHDAPSLAPEQ